MPNNKHLVVVVDHKVVKVRNVDDLALANLENEQKAHEQAELQQKLEKEQTIKNIESSIKDLKGKNLHLAKSLFNDFVDRGLCQTSDKFEKDYYDFVFNGKELKLEETPTDFQTIYRKVCD